MRSSDTEENVGFSPTQVDPWDKARLALIQEIDTDSDVRYEIFKLSASKLSACKIFSAVNMVKVR
jgi:hypothetical protein